MRIRFHGRCLIYLACTFTGVIPTRAVLLRAQALPATGLPGQVAVDALPSAPAAQPDALSAWNDLLRDVMRLGMRASSSAPQHNSAASPLDAPLPGETNGQPVVSSHASPLDRSGISAETRSASDAQFSGRGMSAWPTPDGTAETGRNSPMRATGFRNGGMNTAPHSGGMGGGQPGGSPLNFGSLFQLAGDLGRGLDSSGHTSLGTALGTLPTLSQLTRSGLSLPMASSAGNFRFSYQSPLSFAGMNGTSLAVHGYGSGFAAYDSPHARSGRFDFSASALMGMGSGSTASGVNSSSMGHGGPGGPGGHGGSNSQSQPSASVSLHLSF